ncbi:MAG: response regulator [Acidimicrobiales bacterium]
MNAVLPAAVRVLVAEDNEDHRFLTVRALRQAGGDGVSVEAVADGEQALDFLYRRHGYEDRERPHLIVLDLKMPRLGGLQVLETVKADEGLRSIPVVVLTSSDLARDVNDAYRLGTNSFVTKPAGTEVLKGLLAVGQYWLGGMTSLPEPPE